MHSRLCSRTSSRRNSRRALHRSVLLFALLGVVTAPAPADSQSLTVDARVGPRSVSVAVGFQYEGDSVLAALDAGMRSEITFVIRLYQPLRGLARLLGDRLLAEYHPSFVAYRDPFTREYVIESAVGTRRRLASEAEFLEDFLTLAAFPIPIDPGTEIDRYYLLCQVQLRPVRLVPALDFLGAVRPGEAIVTPWTRFELEALDTSSGARTGAAPGADAAEPSSKPAPLDPSQSPTAPDPPGGAVWPGGAA